VDGEDNGWTGDLEGWVQLAFDEVARVTELRFVFDSDLNRPEKTMPAHYPRGMALVGVPETLVKAFRVEALGADGNWRVVVHKTDNHQRLVRIDVDTRARALRFIPEATWGAERAHVFAWDAS
jgi:hypothetical protein